jgi:hypothetical protein
MNPIKRRDFLRVAGAGAAGAAALISAGPLAELIMTATGRELRFRAVAGVPRPPLPSYASYVIEGDVGLDTGLGTVTKTLYAGGPDAMSDVVLPGLTRTVRITGVTSRGATIVVQGRSENAKVLLPGENPVVELVVDKTRREVRADLFGSPVTMRLVAAH